MPKMIPKSGKLTTAMEHVAPEPIFQIFCRFSQNIKNGQFLFAMMFLCHFAFFQLSSAWSSWLFLMTGACWRAIWDCERVTSPRKWRLRPLGRGSCEADKEILVKGLLNSFGDRDFGHVVECWDTLRPEHLPKRVQHVSRVSYLFVSWFRVSPKNCSQCHQKNSGLFVSFLQLSRWTWIWWIPMDTVQTEPTISEIWS